MDQRPSHFTHRSGPPSVLGLVMIDRYHDCDVLPTMSYSPSACLRYACLGIPRATAASPGTRAAVCPAANNHAGSACERGRSVLQGNAVFKVSRTACLVSINRSRYLAPKMRDQYSFGLGRIVEGAGREFIGLQAARGDLPGAQRAAVEDQQQFVVVLVGGAAPDPRPAMAPTVVSMPNSSWTSAGSGLSGCLPVST